MNQPSLSDHISSVSLEWPSAEVLEALESTQLLGLWLGRTIERLITVDCSLEDWQVAHFSNQAHDQFLEKGSALDRFCFSVLQTKDANLAQEWAFRLQEGDVSFAQLAPLSIGRSRETGGRMGPLRLEDLDSPLDRLLLRITPGVIQPPLQLGNGRTIVLRLDSRQPAQWDGNDRLDLIQRLYRRWLADTIKSLQAGEPMPGSTCSIPLP